MDSKSSGHEQHPIDGVTWYDADYYGSWVDVERWPTRPSGRAGVATRTQLIE